MQRNPRCLHYNKMERPSQVIAVSDSAFKKVDEDSCHAMRGCIVGIMSGEPDAVHSGTVYVLEVECKTHTVVTRAAFSAECHGAVSASDLVFLLGPCCP